MNDELTEVARELEAQTNEVGELVSTLSDEQSTWRPASGKWCISEHVQHLARANLSYVDPMNAAIDRARSRGELGNGPFKHGWIGNAFVRSMEPPPKRRVKTFAKMLPEPVVKKERAISEFSAAQNSVLSAAKRADGIDLGKANLRSPFFKPLKLTLGQAFRVITAHNRRHIWHIRQALQDPAFPKT